MLAARDLSSLLPGSLRLDLLLAKDGRRLGVEVKRSDSLTRSTRRAIADPGLDRLAVVYPGSRSYPLAEGVSVVPGTEIARRPDPLFGGRSRAARSS